MVAVGRDGQNEVIVRYFSQNPGVSVSNPPPFPDMYTFLHNTLVQCCFSFSFDYKEITEM